MAAPASRSPKSTRSSHTLTRAILASLTRGQDSAVNRQRNCPAPDFPANQPPRQIRAMTTKLLTPCLLLGSLLVVAIPGRAQTPPSPPREAAKPAATSPAKSEPAKSTPPADAKSAPPPPTPAPAASVQQMTREFGEQSKALVDKRKVLLDRLSQAKTEDEKQRILAELRQQQQQRLDQQREVARQIREQMQNKRGEMSAAGPGK
jgi:hypothetical protein